jgi:predicted RNase H-like HicB family nuclease
MKKYVFKVVVEADDGQWSAHCPTLAAQGAATWGETREEALRHMQEVVQLIVNELIEDGEPVPEEVEAFSEPLIAVKA